MINKDPQITVKKIKKDIMSSKTEVKSLFEKIVLWAALKARNIKIKIIELYLRLTKI